MTDWKVVEAKVLKLIATRGPQGCVQLENRPPRGCSSDETRVAFQRLVSRGELVINSDFKLALPEE